MSGDLKKLAEEAKEAAERASAAYAAGLTGEQYNLWRAATPDAILDLYEEIDRLRDLLRRGAQPIHWERSQGYDLDAIRAHAQTTETYKHGDTLLMLVNEGDYLHRVIWESEVAEALSASPRQVETQDEHTVEVRG